VSQSLVTCLSFHGFEIITPKQPGNILRPWLSSVFMFLSLQMLFTYFFFLFFFRVKKGLQDSKVTRYIYLEGFLRGVMVLGLPEPDMIPLSLKG
jgi:hypothetical protein